MQKYNVVILDDGREVQKECVMCGRLIKKDSITEDIDGVPHSFDKRECAMLLKKLRSVYGGDFLAD
jgi:hypothetical protein